MDGSAFTAEIVPHVVIAGYSRDGQPHLMDSVTPAQLAMGDLTGIVSVFHAPGSPTIPSDIGGVSADAGFAGPAEVKFGRSWIAPTSRGQLDFSDMTSGPLIGGAVKGFHRTDTIDLGVVQSGTAELRLEDGSTAMVRPGSFFVISGMQHQWHVHDDGPLVFTVVTVGARRSADDGQAQQ